MPPPSINDVATCLRSPPQFVSKPKLNPLPEGFKPQIYKAYQHECRPLMMQADRAKSFDACLSSAKVMDKWTIEKEDASAGIIEGVATTKLLRFKVRPEQ